MVSHAETGEVARVSIKATNTRVGERPRGIPSKGGSGETDPRSSLSGAKLAILDQLIQLEGVADGMHDSVLQHRVDTIARLPSRWVLGSLQLFVGNFP